MGSTYAFGLILIGLCLLMMAAAATWTWFLMKGRIRPAEDVDALQLDINKKLGSIVSDLHVLYQADRNMLMSMFADQKGRKMNLAAVIASDVSRPLARPPVGSGENGEPDDIVHTWKANG